MVEINANLVKLLREETGVGMMECKKALVDAGGDKEKAIRLLRERGIAVAGKKAARTANQGLVASDVEAGGRSGVMIEVNCETDFVAKNENFQAFVKKLVERAKTVSGELAEAVKEEVVAKIAEIGENIIVRRNIKYDLQGEGLIAAYIHLGGKIGVLVEVGCGKPETARGESFKEVVKDITHHIAACNPAYRVRQDVPEAVLQSEREIYAKQVQNKPANIVQKIVDGKLEKFYSQVCLVEQPFVKDPDKSVTEMLAAKGKELGDTLEIRRFVRYQVGA